jgi:dTDP-4-amino-4,6-dideoxygalactose transaminase
MNPVENLAGVPFIDVLREYKELRSEIDSAVLSVVASGKFVLGPAVENFEAAMARYLGIGHAIGMASCTDALWLGLEALDVGPGDEVITSAFSYIATAGAIIRAGATPVFVDIEPATFNINPAAVEDAITEKTAAIMPVHLFGQMADMPPLEAIAAKHGLAMVEDAAQAHGAAHATAAGTRMAGTIGQAGCFSFYPTKNLAGMGDGGLAVTDDAELARRLRLERTHGGDGTPYVHPDIGHNSRLDSVQAAVLHAKLGRLDAWNDLRRKHAARYDEALAEASGIVIPVVGEGNHHVYHQYTVRCNERDQVTETLRSQEIGFAIYYPVPLHLQAALDFLGYAPGDMPESEKASAEVLSLPVFAGLTEAEQERVIAALT